jgi:hypothetical protein
VTAGNLHCRGWLWDPQVVGEGREVAENMVHHVGLTKSDAALIKVFGEVFGEVLE